jgi:hypothetical protein
MELSCQSRRYSAMDLSLRKCYSNRGSVQKHTMANFGGMDAPFYNSSCQGISHEDEKTMF